MKTALITGGSSGIGYEFARQLLRKDYCVYIIARDQDRLDAAVRSLGEVPGSRVFGISSDVRDYTSLVESLRQAGFTNCDLLVHSAGVLKFANLADSPESLKYSVAVNLQGTAHAIVATLPYLQPGSKVAVLCSLAGQIPFPDLGVYAASKFGQHAYCESIRDELKSRGVNLTMVYPSIVRTPMVTNYRQEDLPPLDRVFHWHNPTRVVETFIRDILNSRRESYISVSDRLSVRVYALMPRTFLWLLRIWLNTQAPTHFEVAQRKEL